MSFPESSAETSLDPVLVRTFGREYAAVSAERKAVLERIHYAEQHVLASLSEPLSKHLFDLKRQDAYLLSQLIDHLIHRR